jgi:uncharacterized protein (TIGR00369 family)
MSDPARLADSVPPGFVDPRLGGFAGDLGPILRHDREGQVVSGFLVDARHCNPSGDCHGGWLSTFADVTMVRMARFGQAGMGQSGEGRWVTTALSLDFLRPVLVGDWVESDCLRLPAGARSCAVQGVARVRGVVVLRMNAAFRQIG